MVSFYVNFRCVVYLIFSKLRVDDDDKRNTEDA